MKKARALYNYEASDPNELSLSQDMIISILKEDDSGWWEGYADGKKGWFPSNFVQVIPQDNPPPPAPARPVSSVQSTTRQPAPTASCTSTSTSASTTATDTHASHAPQAARLRWWEIVKERLTRFFRRRPKKEELEDRGILRKTNKNQGLFTRIKAMLTNFFQRRPSRESLVELKIIRDIPRLYCIPLAAVVEREHRRIPAFVIKCVSYLEEHAIDHEGLYRIAGVATQIQELRSRFNKGLCECWQMPDITGTLLTVRPPDGHPARNMPA